MSEEVETPLHSCIFNKISHFIRFISRKFKEFFRHSGSFKKIYLIISTIGIIIGAIWGSCQIIQVVIKPREIQKEIKNHFSVGDSFFNTFDYEWAIKEYKKICELDKNNIEANLKIIKATRRKLQLQKNVTTKEVKDVLALIYTVWDLNHSLKDDQELLLEKALLLKVDRDFDDAVPVLEKAHDLYPKDHAVIAELGYLLGLTSPDENIQGLDLLHLAVELRSNAPRYYYYLAQITEKAGLDAEAIHAYYQTAKLAVDQDIFSKGVRKLAFDGLLRIFYNYGREKLIGSELDMPLEERAQVLEYFIENSKPDSRGPDRDPYLYLALIYYNLDDLKKAAHAIKAGLPDAKRGWRGYGYLLEPLAKILEEGGFDPSTLEEIRVILKSGVSSDRSFSYSNYPYDIVNEVYINDIVKVVYLK